MAVTPMTAAELTKKILLNEPLFILDVRNTSEFDDWRIEGKQVRTVNKPYFDLLDGIETITDQLPTNDDILVVCAKEGASRYVAEQLAEAGYQRLFYLEGGMKAWSEHLEPVTIDTWNDGGAMIQFVRIGKGCLSYLIASDGEAVVVDANRTTDVYERMAAEKGWTIRHVIDTHLHADHISGGRQLATRTGATYWLPPKDAGDVTFTYEPLEDGAVIPVGDGATTVRAMHTPGHTSGSTSLIVRDQYLLTGDILFVASIGRPDLAGKAAEWVDDLRHTLYEQYRSLPDELRVLPGHFGDMSEVAADGSVQAALGTLYLQNQGLQIHNESDFRRTVTENLPPQPHAYQEIRQTNMGKRTPDGDEQREMEIGPNRCAVHG